MGCKVHGEAKVWLQQNQKQHTTWERRWGYSGIATGLAIAGASAVAAVMALPAVFLAALGAFLAAANVGTVGVGINWLLSRKGKSLVEKAIQAVLEEQDCTKAERMFEAAKRMGKII